MNQLLLAKRRMILLVVFILLEFVIQPLDAQVPKREFRGLWVATVANIDWPSKPGMSSKEQQVEQ